MMLSVVGEEVIRDGWVRQGSSSGRPGKRLGLGEVTRFDKRRCGDRGKKLHCKRVATHYSNLGTLSFQSSTNKALPLLHSPIMLDTGLGITSREENKS